MSRGEPPLAVAVYQCAAGGLDRSQRLAALARMLGGSGAAAARLVICPELFMSGYNIGDALEGHAEAIDGPFAQAVSRLAREHRQAILYGYPEVEGSKRYNSAACFGADGNLLANHRKLALPPGFESRYFQPGDATTFFSLGGLRLALLICYDAEFPEAVRAVARQGAQAVVVPTALKDCWASVAYRMMPTRAFENGVYLIYANHAGPEGDANFLGASCVVGPDGEDLARAGGGEEILLASLEAQKVRKAQARLPYLRDLEGLGRLGAAPSALYSVSRV
jgi:predicted amidohydrolase